MAQDARKKRPEFLEQHITWLIAGVPASVEGLGQGGSGVLPGPIWVPGSTVSAHKIIHRVHRADMT